MGKSRFEAKRLHAAIIGTSEIMGKSKKDVVTQVAKGFLKDIVSITPPASRGAAGSDAKKQGEAAVSKDYARAFKPFDDKWVDHLFHLSGRAFKDDGNYSDGDSRWMNQILGYVEAGRSSAIQKIFRNMKVKRTWLPQVTKKDIDSFRGVNTGRMRADALFVVHPGAVLGALKEATAHVGTLAAGWNPAAVKLGVKLPAWIRRHHTPGSAVTLDRGHKFSITVENAARFIGNVKDYDRRLDWAMSIQAPKLERQADYVLKHGLKKAGWH